MTFAKVLVLTSWALGMAEKGSPVQKVIELLQESKLKIQADLEAESKEMAEYVQFCDDETSARTYAITTAVRTIASLEATIIDARAHIESFTDEVATLGTQMAEKEKQLSGATAERMDEKSDFKSTEEELVTSVDQLERAVVTIKREMSFMQGSGGAVPEKMEKQVKVALAIISRIVDASWVGESSRKALQGLLQTQADEENDLQLHQPQAETQAFTSQSGGIVAQIEDMKEKAEETLSSARSEEMKQQHNFDMMSQSLNDGIKVSKDKLASAKMSIETLSEEKGVAQNELAETKRTKSADESYLSTLTADCHDAARGWEDRQASAKEEMNVIEKAKSILADRVKVFVQAHSVTVAKKKSNDIGDDDDDSSASQEANARRHVVTKLKELSEKFGSYALMEMAGSAAMDPFVKIRGLIEDMIGKLLKEAQEEATQKAFCDEEMGKSNKAKEEKTLTLDKLQSRLDKASARKAELTQAVKDLEAEIASLDASTAEATKIRNEEHETYLKASKDFGDAAAATEKAIKVLKEFYDNASFLQTGAMTVAAQKAKAPEFGEAKSGAGGAIISILEMSNEDFVKLHSETEANEAEAVEQFEKLMNDNSASKGAKQAEVKASLSEIKSLTVALENTGEDHSMTSQELAAVMEYLEKLKPQCEEKVMSYAEKKARREAEIAGLKEALEILAGGLALVQEGNLRTAQLHA